METLRVFQPGGRRKLDFTYLPHSLPHRERHIKSISNTLAPITGSDVEAFFPPLLHGGVGTGKTSSMKIAGRKTEKVAEKNAITLHYSHIPCAVCRRPFTAAQKVAEGMISIPLRGFGTEELLLRVYEELEVRDEYLLLVLDDVDELIRKDRGEFLHIVTRLEEAGSFEERRIFPVLVMREWKLLRRIPQAVASKITGLRIEFKPYTWNEMRSIVRHREKLAFRKGALSPGASEQVSFNCAALWNGNARYGLTLLEEVGLIAIGLKEDTIEVEHVRLAQQNLSDKHISLPKWSDRLDLVILLATARCFRDNPDSFSLHHSVLYRECVGMALKMNLPSPSEADFLEKLEELVSLEILFRVDGGYTLPGISAKSLYDGVIGLLE